MHNTFAIDFFTVPTATFRVLYVFIVLLHENPKFLHFNVTTNPIAKWTAQQIVEVCPWDSAPKYLLRDRDGTYGKTFQRHPIRASCTVRARKWYTNRPSGLEGFITVMSGERLLNNVSSATAVYPF